MNAVATEMEMVHEREHLLDSRTPPRGDEYCCRRGITNSVGLLQLDDPPKLFLQINNTVGPLEVDLLHPASPISYLDISVGGQTPQQKPQMPSLRVGASFRALPNLLGV